MRLQETEGFAGQPLRAAAKASVAARRDAVPIQRFSIEDERGATERSRLERAQTDRKTDADLVERREEKRNLDRRTESASTSESRAARSERLPEGRDRTRSTEPDAGSSRQLKADAAGSSPALADRTVRADPLEKKDEDKPGRASSDERSPQDAQVPSTMTTPLPLGRVLAEAASSPTGRDGADAASETDEYRASTKLDGDDGRGQEAQDPEVQGKEVATAASPANLIPPATPPFSTSTGQAQPVAAGGPPPGALPQPGSDGPGSPGSARVADLAGPGSTAFQAASADPASAAPAATESREGRTDFTDLLAGTSPETAADAIPAHVPAVSLGTAAEPAVSAQPPSPPIPHQGAPVPLGAVPMTIGLRSLSGSSHFEIRLDPVDLGRIDVRLDIDKDRGTVTTSVVVERAETLALLQRDAGNLQQALAQAGLDPGAGISLSLRGEGMAGDQGSGDPRSDGRQTDARSGSHKADAAIQQPLTDYVAPRMLRGIAGIDIRI